MFKLQHYKRFSNLVCLAGYGRLNPTADCVKCPVGQFSSGMSNDPCDTCSAGETTEQEGSTVCGGYRYLLDSHML